MKYGPLTTYALGIAVFLIAFAVVGYLLTANNDSNNADNARNNYLERLKPGKGTDTSPDSEKSNTGHSDAPDEGTKSEDVPKGLILLDDVSPITEDGHQISDMKIGDMGVDTITPFATGKVYPQNTNVTAMLETAKKFIGTPYEYGSDRSNPATFDCSDFVQWVFKQSFGMQLPMSSRGQKDYVKQYGTHRYADWKRATPGDLFFFSAYKGSSKDNYADVQRDVTPVTHVGIYMGKTPEGKHLMIHTASVKRGVTIDYIDNKHWEYRLVYNGRAY